MNKLADKINNFQFAVMSFFLTGGIYVGLGIASMFHLAERDIWITALIGIALSIIPALIFIYIFNYQPDKNIFEKNKILFGKWFGSFINLLLCLILYFIMLIVTWSNTTFSITMYLVKTPEYFISGIFILVAIYAVIKGIETIGRVSEILFYINFIFVMIIIFSLYFQFNTDYFKPVLTHGFMSAVKPVINFLSYLFTPLILMAVIPKNSIKNNKHSNKFIIGSFILGAVFMTIVFVLITGVISPALSTFYRFPAYYVQRKVSIGGSINNLENFLSLHWFFNTLILTILGIYFITRYADSLVNIKTKKTRNILIFIIGMSLVLLRNYIFHDSIVSLDFVEKYFVPFVTLPLLSLILLIIIFIFIKKHKKKAT